MTARRNLDVGKTKRFALKINATIKVIDGRAFANKDFLHSFDSTLFQNLKNSGVVRSCGLGQLQSVLLSQLAVPPFVGRAGNVIVTSKPFESRFRRATLPAISSIKRRPMMMPSSLMSASPDEQFSSGSKTLVRFSSGLPLSKT